MGCREGSVEGLAMTPDFWHGRRVLVTGVTGFKGSWLAMLLARMGAKVSGLALPPPTEPSLFASARLGNVVDWVDGNLLDLGRVTDVIRGKEPEVVFHLGAQPLVRLSYEQPVLTFATNVMGTVHVLEAVRSSPAIRAVVVVTSDKCYEDRPSASAYREEDPLGGHDPYATSKACAELVTTAYRRSFFSAGGPSIATVRAGNVIGGGDWARDRIVPDVVSALAAHRAALIRNPNAVRPWQHVLDPLVGYTELAEALCQPRGMTRTAWNFGPDLESMKPVSSLAGTICKVWGGDAAWERQSGDHAHETATLRIDSARAKTELGWAPRLTYDTAVEWTAGWYRDVFAGKDARARVERQLAAYDELAA